MRAAIGLVVELLKWLFWELKEKRVEAVEIDDSDSPSDSFWDSERL